MLDICFLDMTLYGREDKISFNMSNTGVLLGSTLPYTGPLDPTTEGHLPEEQGVLGGGISYSHGRNGHRIVRRYRSYFAVKQGDNVFPKQDSSTCGIATRWYQDARNQADQQSQSTKIAQDLILFLVTI